MKCLTLEDTAILLPYVKFYEIPAIVKEKTNLILVPSTNRHALLYGGDVNEVGK